MKTLGIDIGANKIAVVAFKEKVLASASEVYPAQTRESFSSWSLWVEKFLKSFISENNFSPGRIGIGVAGIIKDGVVVKSPNLSILDGQDLGGLLSGHFDKEAVLDNDVNCFLRAESEIGSAKGFNNVLALTLGTGLGGAILIDGNIYKGKNGSAGEVGGMIIEANTTFEDLVSAKGVRRQTDQEPKAVEDSARAGDEEAMKIYKRLGDNLGIGLANLVNILDPQIITLGGGMANAHDLFLPATEDIMKKLIINPRAYNVRIVISEFKEYAVAIGAALMAKQL